MPSMAGTTQRVLTVASSADEVFRFIDDPKNMAGHMSTSSWSMGGGRMTLELDAGAGRTVGSQMRLHGWAFGIRLEVRTEVSERVPPLHKAWQTVGAPRLLVIGAYRIGVKITPMQEVCTVEVRIDYDLPSARRGAVWEWLAAAYARWCLAHMTADISRAFATPSSRART
jgi:hypothetical protein